MVRPGRWRSVLVGLAGAALFLLISQTAAARKSASYDEVVHLLSGYRILTEGDFRFNHEHPPLMKMLAAAPVVMRGAARPLDRWQFRSEPDQWPLAHQWVYHRNDADRILRLGRFPVALLGALLGFAVFLAARSLGTGEPSPEPVGRGRGARDAGLAAGAAAVFLFAVEPNLLAHGSLITTDMGMAVFYFTGAAAFWRYLETRRAGWLILTGILFGLNMSAKFTGVILGPVLALMGVGWILLGGSAEATGGKGRATRLAVKPWLRLALSLGVVAAVAVVALGATYGFEGILTTLRAAHLESATFSRIAAGPLGAIPLPVPISFIGGFDHAEAAGQVWWSYLMGGFSQTGWLHYYLVALAVKSTIPMLLLALAGMALGHGAGASRLARWIFLALPPAVILAAFTFSSSLKNIGLRYVLAVYPFLCVLGGIGAVALWRRREKWGKAAAILLLLWAGMAEITVYPDHLAYFNEIAGGPEGGRDWLVDSNLDWGQDLKGLGAWMKANGVDSLYLDYFGMACPEYEGVTIERYFNGGYIAVSVTNLLGVYRESERERYRFLMEAEPVASIGHSIMVYNVSRPPDWIRHPGTPQR
jgi:4-amino-4-deoxy-L-arabinose transferase-like glycosyltransferase